MALRPLGYKNDSKSSLSVGGPTLLPLNATTIDSNVLGITVLAAFFCSFATQHFSSETYGPPWTTHLGGTRQSRFV